MDHSPAVAPPYLATPLRLDPFPALMLAPQRVSDPSSARAFARPYREVTERLRHWETDGHLHRDRADALYLHEYTSAGITIRGLVGLLDLTRRTEGLTHRAVFPHEGVYAEQVDDLATRMEQMRLNPAPILLAHRGPRAVRELFPAIQELAAERRYTDRAGQQHAIWAIRDTEILTTIQAGLGQSRPLIADGHHRYAAYVRLQQRHPATGWDRGLAMLVDQDDTPLFLGAIHRVLRSVRLDDLAAAIGHTSHKLEQRTQGAALAALDPDTLALTDGRSWAVIRLDRPVETAAVEVLHRELLPLLGGEPAVGYHHSVAEALAEVRPGRDTAILMPAVAFDQINAAVAHDRLLPEKATSFQPKPSLGALMRSLDG